MDDLLDAATPTPRASLADQGASGTHSPPPAAADGSSDNSSSSATETHAGKVQHENALAAPLLEAESATTAAPLTCLLSIDVLLAGDSRSLVFSPTLEAVQVPTRHLETAVTRLELYIAQA